MRSFLLPRGYRPLAGISCNVMTYDEQKALARYRPLAGISCNLMTTSSLSGSHGYRPLAGISCNYWSLKKMYKILGYRPLAGISCNILPTIRRGCTGVLSSPCGDKLQFDDHIFSVRVPWLSSPCGDKLQYKFCMIHSDQKGYRPLAGISCNSRTAPKRNSFPAFFKACSAITR